MECLELMHTDMYGTFSVHAWREYNEYSRFGYIYQVLGLSS